MNKNSDGLSEKFPWDYFLLVFLLMVPFWIFGGGKLPLPVNLPVSALGTFVPAIAAAIVTYRRSGSSGVKRLLARAVDFRKIGNKAWLLPALLLPPLIYLLSYAIMKSAGLPLPDPINVPLLAAPIFFVLFFIGDAGEELGWSGYAIDPMQNRWGVIRASLALGIIWAVWHLIPFIQTGNPPGWVLWQSLFTVAIRVLIVWVYNGADRSVFAAILLHVTNNISWSLFPNYGSHYDPFVTGIITSIIAAAILLGWGIRSTSQYRKAGASR